MTVVQYSTLLDPHQLVEVVTRSSRDRPMRRTTLAMDRNTDAAMRPLPITDGCTGGIERHGSNCRNQTIRQDDLVVLHERLGRHSLRSHPLCRASRVIVLDFHSLLPKGSEYNEQTCCADCDRIPTSQDRRLVHACLCNRTYTQSMPITNSQALGLQAADLTRRVVLDCVKCDSIT